MRAATSSSKRACTHSPKPTWARGSPRCRGTVLLLAAALRILVEHVLLLALVLGLLVAFDGGEGFGPEQRCMAQPIPSCKPTGFTTLPRSSTCCCAARAP